MKKSIRKPENWQDFESLCKKLWGEIWECHEIKKNGRSGQNQHGVDVYGIPKNESEYYGIQCKGKDDYTKSQLTKSEIDTEISKAQEFKPKLKKFYLATSANKDSEIEEYIRIKDVENRNVGQFEIHLFSWEDIADLIEENKNTFDWYVKNINHKIAFDVSVTFQNGEKHLEFSPKLIKNHKTYKIKPFDHSYFELYSSSPADNRKTRREIDTESQPVRYYMDGRSFNKSASVFSIRIRNCGNTAIKNYKLYFSFDTDEISADTVDKRDEFLDMRKYSYNTWIYKGTMDGLFEPSDQTLVQKDHIITDDICIRPMVEHSQEVTLKWKLVSEDFDDEGVLTIQLITEVIERQSTEECEFPIENEIILENYTESR